MMRVLSRLPRDIALVIGAVLILGCWTALQALAPIRVEIRSAEQDAQLVDLPASPTRSTVDSQGDVAAILERPVFHRDRRPLRAGGDVPLALASLRLEGTLVLGEVRRALISNTSDPASGARWYGTGGALGAWRIEAIEPGIVSLSNGVETTSLSITGEVEHQASVSSQQRNATPIYLPARSTTPSDEAARRRAALEALYSENPKESDGRGEYE